MSTQTFGLRLKAARDLRHLSQHDVAKLLGKTQGRVSALERGVRSVNEAERQILDNAFPELRRLPLSKGPKLPPPSEIWRAAHSPRSVPGERSFTSRMRTARKAFGRSPDVLLDKIRSRDDAGLCLEFLEKAGLDSSLECMFWLALLAEGARPRGWPPSRVGFHQHRLVDPSSRLNVTHADAPCLEIALENCACLLFPQVTVDVRVAYYRLDALVSVRGPRGQFWLDLEIDGQGHVGTFDLERQELLQLLTVRLTTRDVEPESLLSTLARKIAPLLAA